MEELLLLKKRIKRSVILIFTIIVFCIVILIIMNRFIIKKEYYKASDFKINTIYSKIDYNNNGIDDYSDILLGAKKNIGKTVSEEEFVIYSFKYAGYNINKMIKKDKHDKEKDTLSNFKEYLKRNAKRITKKINKIEEYQPGDILIFNNNIGIISDKRNKDGHPFIIYYKNKIVEEDIMKDIDIENHYRFDTSLINNELLS